MRKLLIATGFMFGGCFAQITELEKELKDTRLLAALGLLEAQNKGSSSGSGAVAVTDNGDQTVTIPAYNLTITKCRAGTSGQYCETGSPTYAFCNAADNSCNGGTDSGSLDGGGTSAAYTVCDGLVLGGHSDWRLPMLDEAKKLTAVSFANLLVVSPGGYTSRSASATHAFFFTTAGGSGNISVSTKTVANNVYCVR